MPISSVLQQAAEKRLGFLGTIGKGGLNALYPNEFEYYLVALELVDANFKTIQYFIFPIMPTGLNEVIPQITNIKKTTGGYSVVSSSQFISTNISLSGNFGRNFKVLLGKTYQDLVQSFVVQNGLLSTISTQSIINGVENFFDNNIKTGYGCIKILQSIIDKAKVVDAQGPRYLLFYNLALGNNYIVKAGDLTFSMSMESNMIWNYSLPLRSIGLIDNYLTSNQKKSNSQLIVDDYIQTQSNKVINNLNGSLSGITSAINKVF